LREVFSAKFQLVEAHFYKMASPGKLPLHRYIRDSLPLSASGRHPLIFCKINRSFAQSYGSRLLTLRQNLRFLRCRLPSIDHNFWQLIFLKLEARVSYLPLHSFFTSVGSLSSPFPCNSGWGSELRFACATVRALDALPMPTIFLPKTGLYDNCRHLSCF
jgi:hypothetical protein